MDQASNSGSTPPETDAQLEREIAEALGGQNVEQLMEQAAQVDDSITHQAVADSHEPKRFEHEIRRGRICAIQGDDVFVQLAGIDGKHQGVVPLGQFERQPRVGSIMDFVVERFDESEGLLILSREGAVSRATWEQLQRGAVVEARVTATNKGGLELELVGGIRAFMPASQIDLHHVDDLDQFIGQKLRGQVQEIDYRSKKIILSRRRHLEHERAAARRKLWAQLEVGQERQGIVSSVVDYGAFVDLGGVDGLAHVSDLSYSRVCKTSDVVRVGQHVKVKVLKIDAERQRVSLGLKQVEPDPWAGIENRIKVGDQVSARVTRTADFGAFVEIEPGVEGLLPVSEISWKRIHKPCEVVKPGDVLRMGVLSIDPAKRRIALSLKQAQGDPWIGAERKYAVNSLVQATVTGTSDFGAFVELEPGVEGLVHISELAPSRVNRVEDVVKIGDRKQFRVLMVDEEQRRVKLSLKAVDHPPARPAAPGEDRATHQTDKKAKPRKPKGS
ncbi:MAG: S1 RNA-binding domain-containing protein, partial [Phycisphaeraceae bacterium]